MKPKRYASISKKPGLAPYFQYSTAPVTARRF